jgi:ribosomal protein S13
MLFIFDVIIPETKRVDLALRHCFGIGLTQSFRVFVKLGFNKKSKIMALANRFKRQLDRRVIQISFTTFHFRVEEVLKNFLHKRMLKIKFMRSLIGLRHYFRLPVRGQRTKNNAQTQKRRRRNWRRTPIAAKKK